MNSILKKFKVFVFGSDHTKKNQVARDQEDLAGTCRKRKLDDGAAGLTKRQKLDMENIDGEEDVEIIPGTSFGDKLLSPLSSFLHLFSPSGPKKKQSRTKPKVIDHIDLTQQEDDEIQFRTKTKDDLNAEVQFVEHVRPAEPIQASPHTRLDRQDEEIQLLKVVNPQGSVTLSGSILDNYAAPGSSKVSNVSCSQVPEFRFNSTGAGLPQQTNHLRKGFRITTGRERELQRERNIPSNLSSTLKSGHRTTYSKIFGVLPPRNLNGVGQCINMEQQRRYRDLLMKNTGAFIPYTNGLNQTYSGFLSRDRSLFSSPKSSSALQLEKPSKDIKDTVDSPRTPGLGSLPLFSPPPAPSSSTEPSAAKPFVESTPLPKPTVSNRVSSLEEENKIKEVYSPAFIRTLNEKYSSKKRELDRKIRAEETKISFHSAKNEELYEDVNERILRHLKLTSTEIEEGEAEKEEEEEDTNLPEITEEMEEVIRSSLRARDNQPLVEAHRIPISGKDIKTLAGLSWLNDEVINFYLQMIVSRSGTGNFQKVHAFNTFFYSQYKDKGYSSLKRWTKKVDLFAMDLILIPVHLGMHWCLATIDMKKKRINYYDSMGGNNNQCLSLLMSYLKEEHQDKKKSEFDESGWESVIVKDIPQQMNGSDCGMFACKFAEYLSRRAKITFSQQDMPYFRRRMVYEIVKNTLLKP